MASHEHTQCAAPIWRGAHNGRRAVEYDYIIVGAGSAGCTLAGRLAQACPDARIALVEAGRETRRSALVNTPLGIAGLVPWKSRYNYGYQTTPQAGLGGRRGFQPRGRGLGGSSAINAMIYTRGHPLDFDEWATLGCTGWGWTDVLPYFRRSEGNQRHFRGASASLHGASGPLTVADPRFINPFSRRFVEAAVQAGYRLNDDFNGPRQDGVGFYQLTQRDGQRCSAARAYLGEQASANLDVLTGTQVLRVEFDGRRARGVRIARGGTQSVLRARAEVVLAAGAFGSPQLLLCSGVGPAAELQALGIPVALDAPQVGCNLQDHLDFIVNRRVASSEPVGFSVRGFARMVPALVRYARRHDGMFASNVAEAGGFLKSDPSLARPDLQLHFCAALVDEHNRKMHWGHGYSLHVCVLRPRSRGTVRLASADARAAPLIDPRFLSDEADLDALARGVRAVGRILDAPALSAHGGRDLYPLAGASHDSNDFRHFQDSGRGCAPRGAPERATPLAADAANESELRDAIRRRADTIYHPVGTCRMGADAEAVVDLQLRAKGLAGLRVVDASVMPTLIGGNTNAPTIMIAERAAEWIAAARRAGGSIA
jgi:choline dehydrogenase-like flavoprotein